MGPRLSHVGIGTWFSSKVKLTPEPADPSGKLDRASPIAVFRGRKVFSDALVKCALWRVLGSVRPPGPNNCATEQTKSPLKSVLEQVWATSGAPRRANSVNTTKA